MVAGRSFKTSFAQSCAWNRNCGEAQERNESEELNGAGIVYIMGRILLAWRARHKCFTRGPETKHSLIPAVEYSQQTYSTAFRPLRLQARACGADFNHTALLPLRKPYRSSIESSYRGIRVEIAGGCVLLKILKYPNFTEFPYFHIKEHILRRFSRRRPKLTEEIRAT